MIKPDFDRDFAELGIKNFELIEIQDYDLVTKYHKLILEKSDLPKGITYKEFEVIDSTKIAELNKQYTQSSTLPENIYVKYFESSNGISSRKYFYKDQYHFYQRKDFDIETIKLKINLKELKYLKQIDSSVFTIKVLVSIIFLIMLLVGIMIIAAFLD